MKNAKRTTQDRRRKNGFTLIELLIAASIFSIIILSIYSAFHTAILSYNKIDSAFSVYQQARISLNRMELDLKNSFAYKADDSGFIGTKGSLQFYAVLDLYKEGKPTTNLCFVKYELSDNSLKRTCYEGLDALKQSAETEAEELVPDLKELIFEYAYPPSEPDKPYEWQTEDWPKDDNQGKILPLAVKIKLSLIERDRRKQEIGVVEFNKIVSLPVAEAVSASLSTGGGGK